MYVHVQCQQKYYAQGLQGHFNVAATVISASPAAESTLHVPIDHIRAGSTMNIGSCAIRGQRGQW
jgi:hypothetical protein